VNNLPVYVTRDQLLDVIDDMRKRVAAGDSYEGSLEYLLPDVDDGDSPDGFRLRAAYRVGNLQGQGGMRMIGRMG
jgi:hypothetical protein